MKTGNQALVWILLGYVSRNVAHLFISRHRRCSLKKVAKFTENGRPATSWKKIIHHRCFSCEYWKNFNTFFYGTPLVAASVILSFLTLNIGIRFFLPFGVIYFFKTLIVMTTYKLFICKYDLIYTFQMYIYNI